MASFTIGPAASAHIPKLQEIELSAGQLFADIGMESIANDPPPEAHELQSHIDDGTLWVALSADDPTAVLGYAAGSVVDGEGHLDQVSVEPEAQGSGIGTALVEMVCHWVQQRGLTAVTLTTFVDVPWNGPYYQRLGFVFVPESEMGADLRAIRQNETENGIDVAPRAAMRRLLTET